MSGHASWGFEEGEVLQPGRIVLKAIGGGSLYEVFLVWDETLCALAVAKVLRPDRVAEEKALGDLAGEAEALGSLAHPTLVRGFDAVLDGDRPHLLLEHLDGPSLRRLIHRDGSIEPQQLLPLAANVAGALQYMAQSGWVHLDVKPDNIIVGVPPRLVDLSIARTLERAAETRGPVGTDAYMAPEQCLGADQGQPIGAAADAWGLGATLFHAISGAKPYPQAEPGDAEGAARFPQLTELPAALPAQTPEGLARLVLDLLEPNPLRRPSCAEAIERLEPLIAELPRKMGIGKRGPVGI